MRNELPAFPVVIDGIATTDNIGLTKRELIAAMAMQGFLSCKDTMLREAFVAQCAVALADALLAELEKQAGKK